MSKKETVLRENSVCSDIYDVSGNAGATVQADNEVEN